MNSNYYIHGPVLPLQNKFSYTTAQQYTALVHRTRQNSLQRSNSKQKPKTLPQSNSSSNLNSEYHFIKMISPCPLQNSTITNQGKPLRLLQMQRKLRLRSVSKKTENSMSKEDLEGSKCLQSGHQRNPNRGLCVNKYSKQVVSYEQEHLVIQNLTTQNHKLKICIKKIDKQIKKCTKKMDQQRQLNKVQQDLLKYQIKRIKVKISLKQKYNTSASTRQETDEASIPLIQLLECSFQDKLGQLMLMSNLQQFQD